jgi:methionyl-tRNA synthetase
MNFGRAFEKIKEIVYKGNLNLSTLEFWKLVKSDSADEILLLQNALYVTFEISRISSALLEAYCPQLTG